MLMIVSTVAGMAFDSKKTLAGDSTVDGTYDLTVTSFFQLLFLPHAVKNM